MSSLISPALIIAALSLASNRLASREPLLQPGQLPVQAPVDNKAVDLGDESAEQSVVNMLFQQHLLAVQRPTEPLLEPLVLARGQRHRRAHPGAHPGAHPAQILVHAVAV